MTAASRHGPVIFASLVLAVLAAASLLAGQIEALFGIESGALDLTALMEPPTAAHPLGTDDLGRDFLSRLLRAGQVSLGLGLVAAVVAAALGTTIGLIAGYFGGAIDALLMRITDGVIALPLLPLLMVLGAIDPAKLGISTHFFRSELASLGRIVVIVVLVGWTTVARLARAATLTVGASDFVRAAAALGASPVRIMCVHILPNIISPVIVATTLSIGNIILLESALSFLGLGVQPPMPSWGNMLSQALRDIYSAPILAILPGSMIFLTVLSFNLVGDGLRDALDPRSR